MPGAAFELDDPVDWHPAKMNVVAAIAANSFMACSSVVTDGKDRRIHPNQRLMGKQHQRPIVCALGVSAEHQ